MDRPAGEEEGRSATHRPRSLVLATFASRCLGPDRTVTMRTVTVPRRGPVAVALVLAVIAFAGCSSTRQEAMDAPDLPPMQATVDDIVTATATATRTGTATVLSSDATQHARVTVPDDALPAGLDGEDITVTVLSLDSPEDGVAGITFDLGPDGTTFTEPVLLQWEGPWSESAVLRLDATNGDGTPIPDTGSTEANSIAALRIEPTGPATARYTLPVTHFSSWWVSILLPLELDWSGPLALVVAAASLPDEVDVGTTEQVPVRLNMGAGRTALVTCISGNVAQVTGPAIAQFPPLASCQFGAEPYATAIETMSFTCTGAGPVTVQASIYAFLSVPQPANDTERGLRLRMLRAAANLRDDLYNVSIGGGHTRTNHAEGGVLVVAPFALTTTCLGGPLSSPPTASSTTTAGTPTTTAAGTTTTTAAGDTTTTRNTTTTAGSGTTSSTTAVSSSTTSPVSSSTTSSSTTAPVSSSTTSSSTTSSSTTTSTTSSTTSTTSGPTTTVWGETGSWAYNEMGSCNWNDTGGCGRYYSATPGTYVIGPIGSAGARYP
jgi:hypothetical protein